MKKLLLFISIAIAGCGAKSNEEIAKDLIEAKMKTTLPDYSKYTSLNHGALGKASLPYAETEQYLINSTSLKRFNDSVSALQQQVNENKGAGGTAFADRMKQFQDSVAAVGERISTAKMNYTPEQLFTMTHAYKLKDDAGQEKTTEHTFYFDKDFTKVVKMKKVY